MQTQIPPIHSTKARQSACRGPKSFRRYFQGFLPRVARRAEFA